jgi:hypothetical protein
MPVTAHSIDDGEGRFASRTRVNKLVYEFTVEEIGGAPMAMARFKMNGKIHRVVVDATRCSVEGGADKTHGTFQLFDADLSDAAGNPYSYHAQISALDYTAASPAPYQFQTSEGAASRDGAHNDANHFVIWSGKQNSGALPKTLDGAGAAQVMDDTVPWTGLVAGTVQAAITVNAGGGNFAADTGSLFLTIYYE